MDDAKFEQLFCLMRQDIHNAFEAYAGDRIGFPDLVNRVGDALDAAQYRPAAVLAKAGPTVTPLRQSKTKAAPKSFSETAEEIWRRRQGGDAA
jgi:hypothetical protein